MFPEKEEYEYDDLLDYDTFVEDYTAAKKRKFPDKRIFFFLA
ncbi:MAG: hypothetical protein ACI3W6_02295 [Clostridia bacterium]